MPALGAFALAAQENSGDGVPVTAPDYVDAIFLPYIGFIEIITEHGASVYNIDVQADTGFPSGGAGFLSEGSGFAFSDNYTKLIVPAGDYLDWYLVDITPTSFSITYQGHYAALGFKGLWILQSSPHVGDFMVVGFNNFTDLNARAAYVTNAGAVTSTTTWMYRGGWLSGTFNYVSEAGSAGNGIYSKDVLSDDPTVDGYDLVFATPTCLRYQTTWSEIFANGNVYNMDFGSACDASFISEMSAGGTPTSVEVAIPPEYTQMGSGICSFIRSYLYQPTQGYVLHNKVDTTPTLWRSRIPFDSENEIAVVSQPDNLGHCYKYPNMSGPPTTPAVFPGLENSSKAGGPIWGPPLL